MFARTLEAIQAAAPRRVAYTCGVFAFLAFAFAVKTMWFSRLGMWHDRNLVDFDVFHIVAQKVWAGGVEGAYHFTRFLEMQREASGGQDSFMPWTYPPQFALLVAPLGLIPVNVGYFLFVVATFAFYIVVLRAVARDNFTLLLLMLFPAMEITMACGQNGFLTAGFIGLVCLFFEERPVVAGLALGLMIIKPHLAIAFATYAIAKRSWTVVATAAAVVLTTSAICTVVFGTHIWLDFLDSVRDSSAFLEKGYYPLFRMVSAYAALRSAGISAWVAFVGQGMVALLALGLVVLTVYRRMPSRTSLGLTAALSLCISPYAYDYDFLVFGIGLAMLLPALQAATSERERTIIYAAPMLVGGYGVLRTSLLATSYDELYVRVFSGGGLALAVLMALIVLALLRSPKHQTVASLSVDESFAKALQ
jgi:Glycosyltransferase family 87